MGQAESGRQQLQDWIFIGLSGERTARDDGETIDFSDLFSLETSWRAVPLRVGLFETRRPAFFFFFFFSTSGIALDGSETAMAPLLNDASRHRQKGLVIETDNRWTFQSFDFERSALLFDHSKPTRPRETGRNLRALVRTTLDRAAIFMTFFSGPCLPN